MPGTKVGDEIGARISNFLSRLEVVTLGREPRLREDVLLGIIFRSKVASSASARGGTTEVGNGSVKVGELQAS